MIEGLKKYFEQFVKVEACTFMRDSTGRSRCFAFLTFEDPASVNAVMVREHVLDGKIVCFIYVYSFLRSTYAFAFQIRLIQNALFPGKNIKGRPNSLSVVSQGVSPLNLCANSSPSLVR